MAENPNSVNDRLQQDANGGTPQIDPDQQRKYLGTFRERVSLVIPIKDMNNPKAYDALNKDMKKHPNEVLLVNANSEGTNISHYMTLASKNNIKFTMKSDAMYFNKPNCYGVVLANPTEAINENPILWNKKYKLNNQSSTKNNQNKSKHRQTFLNKLKKWL